MLCIIPTSLAWLIQPSTLGWELSLKTLGGVIIRWNQKLYSIANNAAQHVN